MTQKIKNVMFQPNYVSRRSPVPGQNIMEDLDLADFSKIMPEITYYTISQQRPILQHHPNEKIKKTWYHLLESKQYLLSQIPNFLFIRELKFFCAAWDFGIIYDA